MNIHKEEELICSASNLMKETWEQVPMRLINVIAGSTVMGILLDENQDSFLVAYPTRLIAVGEAFEVEAYLPVPYARFFKSTILNMTPMLYDFETRFIQYVLAHQDQYPSYWNKRRETFLTKRLGELEKAGKTVTTSVEQKVINSENNSNNGPEGNNAVFINSASKYKH